MTQSTDIASPAVRFSEAVRAFAPVCTSRYAKLLSFKDGIVELRQMAPPIASSASCWPPLMSPSPWTPSAALSARSSSSVRHRVRALVGGLSERCPSPQQLVACPLQTSRSFVHGGAASRAAIPLNHPILRRLSPPWPSRQRSVRALVARASPTPPTSNRPDPHFIFAPTFT
jgi:hypothetical protein